MVLNVASPNCNITCSTGRKSFASIKSNYNYRSLAYEQSQISNLINIIESNRSQMSSDSGKTESKIKSE